ncbi:uncharacterized protein LOC129288037 isoform X3 [Prosopis cineraria]|uniref:uncharacterized protein LOC129288037 isoform X3 n=1 Tax=Prosopis cineraria TaxID=364024 RepID=UPI0024106351|nr:uncharacterized protein LOC129288037 isoform X3 [Prosopis cineraria]
MLPSMESDSFTIDMPLTPSASPPYEDSKQGFTNFAAEHLGALTNLVSSRDKHNYQAMIYTVVGCFALAFLISSAKKWPTIAKKMQKAEFSDRFVWVLGNNGGVTHQFFVPFTLSVFSFEGSRARRPCESERMRASDHRLHPLNFCRRRCWDCRRESSTHGIFKLLPSSNESAGVDSGSPGRVVVGVRIFFSFPLHRYFSVAARSSGNITVGLLPCSVLAKNLCCCGGHFLSSHLFSGIWRKEISIEVVRKS